MYASCVNVFKNRIDKYLVMVVTLGIVYYVDSSIFNSSGPKRHLPYLACARALSVRAALNRQVASLSAAC